MLINPLIVVFTFTRRRWRSTYYLQFRSSLAGVKNEDQLYAIYLIYLLLSSRNSDDSRLRSTQHGWSTWIFFIPFSSPSVFVTVSSVFFLFLLRWFGSVAWFAFTECRFREKAVVYQRHRFYLLLGAMPEKILDQIIDVVENVPEDFTYGTLKARLLKTHNLSDQEKMDISSLSHWVA
jgi:hypothetical protein